MTRPRRLPARGLLLRVLRRVRAAASSLRGAAQNFDALDLPDGYYTCDDRDRALKDAQRRRPH